MPLEFDFVKVSNEKIINFIHQAKQRLLFVKPAFFKWEIEQILSVKENNYIPQCEIYLENGDEAIRFGFGDHDALELMKSKQDLIMVQLVDRVRLSILVVDNNCLIYSPSIVHLDDKDKPSDFPNGFYGDKNVVEKIINKFPTYTFNKPSTVDNEHIDSISNPFEGIEEIVKQHHQNITEELGRTITILKKNPPVDPSNLRKVNIYRNNYKILKRQIVGIMINHKKINLNAFNRLLSTNNKRLLSSWSIFTNDDIQELQDMTYFGKELQTIDDDLLLDVGRFGLLIETTKISEYNKSVNSLKEEFVDFMKEIPQDKNRFIEYKKNGSNNTKSLNQVLEDSRADLIKYLITLANAEEAFEKIIFKEDRSIKRDFELKKINKEDMFERFINNFVDNTFKFPNKEELLERIDIKHDFYDISDELLNNNPDFDIFIKKYDLDNLRRYGEGFEQIEMEI